MAQTLTSTDGLAILANAHAEPGEVLLAGNIIWEGDILGDGSPATMTTLTLMYVRQERVRVGRRTRLEQHNRVVRCVQRSTPDGHDYHWVPSGRPMTWVS